MKNILFTFLFLIPTYSFSQNYTSYFTGNATNVNASTNGGICLMGGATENDSAMRWFLDKANGGDILVIRASGSDGYNLYMYSQLGATVNSVETIVFNNGSASNESYIHTKIAQAEAIWIAGGDQWNYVSYWRNTKIDTLLNDAINVRKIPVGGTSAGMAIMGKYYFTAENGTVTSSVAMANPYNSIVATSSTPFLSNVILNDVITDTHFDNPDRKGRLMAFIARAIKDDNFKLKGIACDEYTAVCIEPNGLAKVYGNYPTDDDNAYFIQPNCELSTDVPEQCIANSSLIWNYNGKAAKVYKVKGTMSGTNTFNLLDWRTGSGGNWETWGVLSNTVNESSSVQISCNPANVGSNLLNAGILKIYPNPASTRLHIEYKNNHVGIGELKISNLLGLTCYKKTYVQNNMESIDIDVSNLANGIYLLQVNNSDGLKHSIKFVKH
jgi:cyanophycinase-like exopeptidase